ncbi:MAG: site-2 protease family protein [Opitutaceae bacterium]|jgi:Zn-dependent protease
MDFGITLATLRSGLILYLVFIASLCIREWARAWTVDRLGDPNPAAQGRLTLNPMAHMDLLGSVIFPFVCIFFLRGGLPFGWGKPLIPNPAFFNNPKRGEVISALSGPAANFCLAMLAALVGGLVFRFDPHTEELFIAILQLNVLLAVINLLPLPPLDGGVLLKHATGMAEETYFRVAQWSWLVLLVVMIIPAMQRVLGIIMYLAILPIDSVYRLIAG